MIIALTIISMFLVLSVTLNYFLCKRLAEIEQQIAEAKTKAFRIAAVTALAVAAYLTIGKS